MIIIEIGLVLPTAQFDYNSYVNRSISMRTFEIVYNYKPGKPLNLLSMSLHASVYESIEYFVCRI